MEKEKEKAREIQQKKTSLLQQLQEEDKSKIDQMNELATAKELINESTLKMSAAVEGKNMQSVKVAQMMLKAGNEKLQEVSQKLVAVRLKQKNLRKRLEGTNKDDALQAKKKTL